MGGEKLNRIGIFITALILIFGGGAGNIPLLSAQVPDVREEGEVSPESGESPASATAIPEESLFLDEAPPGLFPVSEESVFPTILRIVVVLALVAVFIYAAVFFLKKFFKRISSPQEAANPYLKVLTRAHLDSGHFVYVVSVGPKQAWLVGTGDSGVSLIAEIGDKETVDALLLEDSRKNNEPGSGKFPDFRSLLRRLGGETGHGPGPSPEDVRKRRERLRSL